MWRTPHRHLVIESEFVNAIIPVKVTLIDSMVLLLQFVEFAYKKPNHITVYVMKHFFNISNAKLFTIEMIFNNKMR